MLSDDSVIFFPGVPASMSFGHTKFQLSTSPGSTDSPPQRENTTAKTPLWSASPESQGQKNDPQNRTPNIWAIAVFTPTDEMLNTAVLTGRAVSLPLRVLGISSDGYLWDVTHRASCHAPQPDILKVSANCQSAVLEGRERGGSTRASLLLSLETLSTTLTLHVWFPQLPLRLALSDGHLSPIKGWRAPRPGDSRGGCRLQSQRAMLRVWTHLCANVNSHQLTCLPGPDWMADVTSLVRNHLTIEDKRVAVLIASRVVVGRTPGTTAVQVLSPFSDAILGERVLTVGADRTALRSLLPRPIASLQLQLSPEPMGEQDGKGETKKANGGAASLVGGAWKIFNLSVQMNTSLSRPGQESVLALWVQFSDATTTPLDLYPRESYHLEVDGPVLKNRAMDTAWPRMQPSVIVKPSPEARVHLFGACRKAWRQGPLASGTAKVVGQPELSSHQASAVPDALIPGALASGPPARAGGMRLEPPTQPIIPTDDNYSEKEGQIMITNSSSDDLSTVRPSNSLPVAPSISDLQAGVLTFLAAFGLALALFAVNCAIMVGRRRRLKAAAPPTQPEEVAAREWHRNATPPCVELPRSVTPLGDKPAPLLNEAVVTGSGHRKRVTFASVATVHSSAEVQRAIPQEWISMETVSDLA
uniref:Transmembrane protein 132D n=1 Tax=Eptatretus burgeri TaxID=7764 RepID=A0A8C4QUJ7_EPTBU